MVETELHSALDECVNLFHKIGWGGLSHAETNLAILVGSIGVRWSGIHVRKKNIHQILYFY